MSAGKNQIDISTLTFEQIDKVRKYLKKMIELGGSDLHVKANSLVRARIDGKIIQFDGEMFSKEDALTLSKELLRGRFTEFIENKQIDLVYPFDERNRFRVNVFFQMDGVSAVFRTIPISIPSIDELNFPDVIKNFANEQRGLVLVTGITGSGKSTTLAAMINEINQTHQKHILTIEDPIEFVHKDKNCIINQRSVGQDTLSFGSALRSALREDPDIILVGEMRDRETINLALHAADTGHLVFSTLHTIDAKDTINRIIATFPIEEQKRIRLSLAGVLKGVISQRLIPTVDGGRCAAMEVLVSTPTIEKLIMENRDFEILDTIEKGREHYKSQSFDQAILDLYNEGIISKDKAKDYATSASDLELKMNGLNSSKISSMKNTLHRESDYIEENKDVFGLK